MTALLILLTIHFVADFVCQSDWMATRKSYDWAALGFHAAVYGSVMYAGVCLWSVWWASTGQLDMNTHVPPWTFVAVTPVIHFVQDALTSRWTAYLWKKEDRHNFFVVIGLDQLLHAYALGLGWLYWGTF